MKTNKIDFICLLWDSPSVIHQQTAAREDSWDNLTLNLNPGYLNSEFKEFSPPTPPPGSYRIFRDDCAV